jgi:hypothetical protein
LPLLVKRKWEHDKKERAAARLDQDSEQGQSREWFRLTVGLDRGFHHGVRMRFDATWEKEGRIFGDGSTDNLFLQCARSGIS